MNNPKVVVFGESQTASADYDGESTYWSLSPLIASRSLDINLESKKQSIIYQEDDTDQIKEVTLDGFLPTGFSIPDIKNICSIQIDYLSGDVYILNNSVVTPNGSNFWGGKLYRQKKSETTPSVLSIGLNLFRPQDMKIDPPRRRLWIADTGNHRLISVNIDTLKTNAIYEFENLIACCGIAINQTTGALVSRWFDTSTLQENIVFIDDEDVRSFSSFSDFPWGDFTSESNNGDLLLITAKSKKGVYRIKADGSRTTLDEPSENRTPVSISEDPIYGTISVLYADGTLTSYSNNMEYLGQINYPSDSKKILFPSSYGLSHWIGNYRSSIKAHAPINLRIEPYVKNAIRKTLPLKDLVTGVCDSADMRPVFLRKEGQLLITLSRDGSTIQKSTLLTSKHNLIAQDPVNGDIIIALKGAKIVERYTRDHIKINEYEMSDKIVSIDSKKSGDGLVWVLLEDRMSHLVVISTVSQIISSVFLPGTTTLKFIKGDMASGGAWASSIDRVYKISASGTYIEFTKSGFSEIVGIAPQNYLSKLYNSNISFTSQKSMSYDGIRNQAWWVSNPSKKLIGMVNFNTDSGGTLKVYDRLFSSSSVSSKSSSSLSTEILTTSSFSSISSLSSISSSSSLSSSSSSSSQSSTSSSSSSSQSSKSSSSIEGVWSYVISDPLSATITGYLGHDRNVAIPSEVKGVPVKFIQSNSFNGKDFISVIIPDSIEIIGNSVFSGCTSLTNVTFGSGITSIGSSAFLNCTSLTTITLPTNLTSISNDAFRNCGITSISIPANVNTIGQMAFAGCLNLSTITVDVGNAYFSDLDDVLFNYDQTTLVQFPAGVGGSYIIPDGVISLNYGSFYNCSNLTGVDIPDSVTTIGDYTFYNCSNISTIEIPDLVSRIQPYTFYNCTGLTSVDIPSIVYYIGAYAFYNCSSLTSVDIPSGITFIYEWSFYNCTSITSIVLPSGVTAISTRAFQGVQFTNFIIPPSVTTIGSLAFYQTKITSIYIPDSVFSIGDRAFGDCSDLTAIIVGSSNANYCDHNGILYNKSKTTLIQCPCAKAGTYSILAGVTNISGYAFYRCNLITGITTEPGPLVIGDYAFAEMASLLNIVLSEGVTGIGQRAFQSLPMITSFSIPASVTSIGGAAFTIDGNLLAINVSPSNAHFSEDSGVLYNKTFTKLIQCPGGKTGTYAALGTTTELGYASFYLSKLTDVTLPVGLIIIGESSFNASKITSVTVPSSVTSIGFNAFINCADLPDIIVSPGNTSYSDVSGVLFNYSKTTLIQVPRGKTGAYAIPSSVLAIGQNAFYLCTGITSVTFPYISVNFESSSSYSEDIETSSSSPSSSEYGVKTIGESAFYSCTGIASLIIPSSITSLGNTCFQGCSSMTTITFNGNAPTLGTNVFYGLSGITTAQYYEWGTGFNSTWTTKANIPAVQI